MRAGKYWSEKNLEEHSRNRISRIIDGEFDESIRESVREKANHLTEIHHFQMLPEWLAKYIVYNRHSERAEEGRWTSIADVDRYLRNFRQHSLKNPIVEQVITETLRVVRDIWEKYGNGAEGFFDEIHVELGREMKSPKSVRERIARQNATNADTNLRIRALLAELINDNSVENVRPGSPMQQEILKIFEDGILNSDIEIPHDIQKISRSAYPSTSELQRYKLWMEQKYRSPYTGDIIPLNKLFTPAYEIEHVIPQQRYYDDSLSNKVICESAVNKLKNNQTALEFIQNHHGEVVELGMGKKTRVFSEEEYTDFIGRHFANNPPKKSKLMTLDIPEKMIARQLNDTRYISRLIMQLLSNIVREEKSDEAFNSKNVLATNGQITTKLKKDWGLDAVWNELILARFTRMNEITRRNDFTVYHEKYQKFLPAVPLDQKAFSKKRIDHRHHALDALVIACATRNHINFLNNQHAIDKNKEKAERTRDRQKLKAVLCEKKYNADSEDNYKWTFKQPWEHFMPDCKFALENTIASFKKNTRVVNKTINTYQVLKNGKRDQVRQVKGESWAIRKSLHKDTVSGLIRLRKTKFSSLSAALETPECIVNTQLRRYVQDLIAQGYDKKRLLKHLKESGKSFYGMDISRVEIFYWDNDNVASRVSLDSSFTPAKIGTVTDTGIQKILLSHLAANDNNPEVAFTPEGIEEMNKNIVVLNSGRLHQPILKVRTCEPLGNKFVVGQSGNKASKYVEADKGTNLYFAVYESPEKKRCFDTVPLNIVIERQKQGLSPVPERNEKNYPLAFYLSPNDLIYIPTKEEQEISAMAYTGQLTTEQCRRLYKVVSFTGSRLYAIPCNVATSIVDKVEFTQLNKMERSLEGEMVKETCWKVECNRLGNITKINGRAIQTLTEQGIENIS